MLEEAEARKGRTENYLGRQVWTERSERGERSGQIVGYTTDSGAGGVRTWTVRFDADGEQVERRPGEVRFM